MAEQLGTAQEVAVDLEHHSFRTFQGITCLMQLSDRSSDFLVDVLKLRRHIGQILAPLFADPMVSNAALMPDVMSVSQGDCYTRVPVLLG